MDKLFLKKYYKHKINNFRCLKRTKREEFQSVYDLVRVESKQEFETFAAYILLQAEQSWSNIDNSLLFMDNGPTVLPMGPLSALVGPLSIFRQLH